MSRRNLILLFFSAMTISLVTLVIGWNFLSKKLDFNIEVKNPESAPSPIDAFEFEDTLSNTPVEDGAEASEEEEEAPNPSRVTVPEEAAPSDEEATDAVPAEETPSGEQEQAFVPLKPQTAPQEGPVIPLPATDPHHDSLYYVVLDGFSSKETAEQAVLQMQSQSLPAQPYIRNHEGKVVLQFGVFSSKDNAEALAQQLRNHHIYAKVN